ncbi:hypothetical protein [Allosphingosinicella sp.]|jgi:hypothetical protein|uniref:hypothetical protein n=1 Tax=Allosphingosinicella sp. TaxID=2823234 RepID=UPI002F008B2A
MAKEAEIGGTRRGIPWRILGWSVPVILLLLPLIAMQFTEEVDWTASDFVFATVLFGSVGLAFEFIVRKSTSVAYRCAASLAVIAAFLTIWANGAVGMIGSEDNPYNIVFGGVLLVALIGSVMARLEPLGMARAMAVAAAAQAVASGFGFTTDVRGAIFSMGFAGFWLLSAALFWNAARDRATTGAGELSKPS